MSNNRTTRFVHSLATGWFSMGVNVLYTMGSIPLALHYLTKEEFGLWALIMQLASYLNLIDLGMTGSVSRHLIDHKDQKNDGTYGAFIQTSVWVGVSQGAIVAVLGSLSSLLISSIIHVPPKFQAEFQILFAIQCVILGLGFCSRIFTTVLQAHQRLDVYNLTNTGGYCINFLFLWLGFHWGMGLYAMVFSVVCVFVWTTLVQMTWVLRLKLFPDKGHWGKPSRTIFRELFGYGKDIFLMSLGVQFLSASQVIIVTRTMGLEAGAIWSICTKIYTLVQRFIYQIGDLSYVGFSEMFVRGEHQRLARRFRDSFVLSGSLGVLVAVVSAACNVSFITVWTQGKITWNPVNDALFCLLLILSNINRTYGMVYVMSKKIEFARWLYLIEGIVFIVGSYLLGSNLGFPGIIICSIAVDCIFTGGYGYYRSVRFFATTYRMVIFGWPAPCLRFLAIYGIVAFACWSATNALSPVWKFGSTVFILLAVGLPAFWKVGLTMDLRRDISAKLSSIAKFRKSAAV